MNALVPTRHPSSPRPTPGLIQFLARLVRAEPLSDAEWQRLGESLMVGDEPMDRLVEWMHSTGMPNTRPLFERALQDGIASVSNAPEPLREFFIQFEKVPEWVDMGKIRRAQRALRSGGADGMYIARDVALLGGYMFSGFNKTLIRTGALKKGSNKRFAETAQWAMDVISEGGLEPAGVGYRSTIRVRMIHSFVRRQVMAMPDWQTEDWGIPVNQTDMIATLLGALIAPSMGSIGMGMLGHPSDSNAVAHLTRYVGWLIGVEEERLPHNFRDAVASLCNTLAALSDPDESTQMLTVPMANDPLSWKYDNLQWLRRRIARNQHLSITQAYLGPRVMRTLGLPMFVPPWYPILRIPVNAAKSLIAMTLPGGMDRAADRGWREIQEMLQMMVGSEGATVGDSTVAKAA